MSPQMKTLSPRGERLTQGHTSESQNSYSNAAWSGPRILYFNFCHPPAGRNFPCALESCRLPEGSSLTESNRGAVACSPHLCPTDSMMDENPMGGQVRHAHTHAGPLLGDGSFPLLPSLGAQLHLVRHSVRLMDGQPAGPPSLQSPPTSSLLRCRVGSAVPHSVIQQTRQGPTTYWNTDQARQTRKPAVTPTSSPSVTNVVTGRIEGGSESQRRPPTRSEGPK